MAKLLQNFQFDYPLKHKKVCDGKVVSVHEGFLQVSGTAYLKKTGLGEFSISVDVDFIKWKGTDIKAVLEVTGNLEEVEEACIAMAEKSLFPEQLNGVAA